MSEKIHIKFTPESLTLLAAFSISSISEMSGFYNKEVFLSDQFAGDTSHLFQALGNIGAYARSIDLDVDISFIVISDRIFQDFENGNSSLFISELEDRYNQNNSPYRRMRIITESQLVAYIGRRAISTKDSILRSLVKSYKDSTRKDAQQSLF